VSEGSWPLTWLEHRAQKMRPQARQWCLRLNIVKAALHSKHCSHKHTQSEGEGEREGLNTVEGGIAVEAQHIHTHTNTERERERARARARERERERETEYCEGGIALEALQSEGLRFTVYGLGLRHCAQSTAHPNCQLAPHGTILCRMALWPWSSLLEKPGFINRSG
jgi:hypothetical protein